MYFNTSFRNFYLIRNVILPKEIIFIGLWFAKESVGMWASAIHFELRLNLRLHLFCFLNLIFLIHSELGHFKMRSYMHFQLRLTERPINILFVQLFPCRHKISETSLWPQKILICFNNIFNKSNIQIIWTFFFKLIVGN